MVKPDVKHNYYADLELPTNASIDDVRKAYRKLALQYHPDRNSGREEECVPKFQAIQQANEVLGDAAIKQKYDVDRRKAGLYPSTQPTGFTPRQPTPGNPYTTATSAYPPPPRRTQPGTWHPPRPAPAAGAAPPPGGATGADRFSNFPRPAHPTAKKDHAQDRANMFQAWQNMNTPQGRQARFNPQSNPQQPQPPPQPQPQAQPPPQPARARGPPGQAPQPPPRPTNNMPTEEQIRAGTKYRQPPPAPGADGLNERQKAWQAFEQNGPSKPGINRSNTTRTPRRQGFNPNTPGSDERAAPSTGAGYVHRNKSADFGRPQRQYPPPPPGAPPPNQMPTSPLSPNISPTSARPSTDPTRPDRTQVPFSEGNRNRTPYTSFIGEKTDFGGDNLRRSHSTRDTTKLDPGDAASKNRARSSSPPRRETTQQAPSGGPTFAMYESSSAASSSSDMGQTPNNHDSATNRQQTGSGADQPHRTRPIKTPTAPSSRYNGSRSGPSSPMPPPPGTTNVNGNAAPSGSAQQGPKPSMYANPSPFDQKAWITATFGSLSTSRAKQSRFKLPSWAIPGSVDPSLKRDKPAPVESVPYTTAADRVYICATADERNAYIRFIALLQEAFDHVPYCLDMTLFNTIIALARHGISSGKPELDRVVTQLFTEFPSVGISECATNNDIHADQARPSHSFTFPNSADLFTTSAQKSRSAEHINTTFSPDDWHGTFTGQPDYFAGPPDGVPKSRSPTKRPVSSRAASSQRRAATMEVPPTTGTTEASERRPWGSDGQYAPNNSGQQHFEEPDGLQGRDADDPDAMDLDDTPPAHRQTAQAQQAEQKDKEARLYSVAPSAWRQQQDQAQQPARHRKTSSASRRSQRASASSATGTKLNTNLDDLRNVEPISRTAAPTVGGGFNMSSMGDNLPFESASANSIAPETLQRQRLDIPKVPVPPGLPSKWTKVSWHHYSDEFANYLQRQHEFNKNMLSYFAVRLQSDEQLITTGGTKAWLEASGVTQNGIGFDAYANDVQRDAEMREAWNIGCEKHRTAVKQFGEGRERVKGLAEKGVLQ